MDTLKQDLNIGELLSKHRDYVLIGVIVLVSIIAARFIYGKQMEEYARIKEEIHIEQEKSDALSRIVLIDQNLKTIKNRGWDTTAFDTINSHIGALARSKKVKIINVEPMDAVIESHYTKIPFRINAQADTESLVRFVKSLETYPMLTKVSRIVVSGPNVDDQGKVTRGVYLLEIAMTIEAYYFK